MNAVVSTRPTSGDSANRDTAGMRQINATKPCFSTNTIVTRKRRNATEAAYTYQPVVLVEVFLATCDVVNVLGVSYAWQWERGSRSVSRSSGSRRRMWSSLPVTLFTIG